MTEQQPVRPKLVHAVDIWKAQESSRSPWGEYPLHKPTDSICVWVENLGESRHMSLLWFTLDHRHTTLFL